MVRSAQKLFPGPIPPIETPDGLIDEATYRRSDGSFPERDGTNPVERMALHRVVDEMAALTASEVVQIAIWPLRITELARLHDRSSGILYNTLSFANGRPYEPVRKLLVAYLQAVGIARGFPEFAASIDRAALCHLIKAERAERRRGRPLPAPGRRDRLLELPAPEPFDPAESRRTGNSPVERLALSILRQLLPALPASLVVQHALGDLDLAVWAERNGTSGTIVYNMLGFQHQFRYPALRRALADYLGVSVFALDWLIEARRPLEPFKVGLHRAPRTASRTGASAPALRTPPLAAQGTLDLS